MKESTTETIVVIAFSLILISFGFMIGMLFGEEWEKRSAIDAGVAEWQIDPKEGVRKFVYLTPESKP